MIKEKFKSFSDYAGDSPDWKRGRTEGIADHHRRDRAAFC
jgi:hypothetical protein